MTKGDFTLLPKRIDTSDFDDWLDNKTGDLITARINKYSSALWTTHNPTFDEKGRHVKHMWENGYTPTETLTWKLDEIGNANIEGIQIEHPELNSISLVKIDPNCTLAKFIKQVVN